MEYWLTYSNEDWMITGWFVLVTVLIIRLIFAGIKMLYDILVSYPDTQFGFKGTLVYCDDSPSSKVFINHRYELSAKPDFIYKIGWGKYAAVEYKSRQAQVKPSDINQLLASVVAARSKYHITHAYVVTKTANKHIDCNESTRSIYKKIAHLHKIARRIKHRNVEPKLDKGNKCRTCGYEQICNEK